MERKFDFDGKTKKMPYTVPDDFFDEMERKVWEQVAPEMVARRPRFSVRIALGAGIAAALLLFAVTLFFPKKAADTFAPVEQAFSELTPGDRSFLSEVYDEDVFLNTYYINE